MEAERLEETVVVAPAESEESVMELLEQLARELGRLVLCETRLAAARHKPELRRAGRDAGAAVLAAVALASAFVLANVAAVIALSTAMPAWAAALVLCAVWAVVGLALAFFLRARARTLAGWERQDAEQARAEAEQAVRETLERLAPVVSRELTLAAVPMADDIASGLVDAGDELLDGADAVVDAITDDIPGGGIVNQVWDVVLLPGRYGIRVATTVLKR